MGREELGAVLISRLQFQRESHARTGSPTLSTAHVPGNGPLAAASQSS